MYEVASVNSQTQIERKKAGMSLQDLNTTRHIPEEITTPQEEEESGMY